MVLSWGAGFMLMLASLSASGGACKRLQLFRKAADRLNRAACALRAFFEGGEGAGHGFTRFFAKALGRDHFGHRRFV